MIHQVFPGQTELLTHYAAVDARSEFSLGVEQLQLRLRERWGNGDCLRFKFSVRSANPGSLAAMEALLLDHNCRNSRYGDPGI